MKSSISAFPNRLGRLVDVHHHGPMEVRHGAGYCVHIVVGERTAVFGDVGELAPRTLARPLGLLALGPLRPELVTWQRPNLLRGSYHRSPTILSADDPPPSRSSWQGFRRDPHRVSINRTTAGSAHTPPKPSKQHAAEPSAIRLPA